MHAGGDFTAVTSNLHTEVQLQTSEEVQLCKFHLSEAKDSIHRKRLSLITCVPGLRGVTRQHSTPVKARCLAMRSQGRLSSCSLVFHNDPEG